MWIIYELFTINSENDKYGIFHDSKNSNRFVNQEKKIFLVNKNLVTVETIIVTINNKSFNPNNKL